jgi:hypothetical protein
MLFMVIERFASGNPLPIYARFRDQGRLAPEGLKYVSSWVSKDLTHCYQVMETDNRGLLAEWMAKWNDLADFEVEEVVTSMEAEANVLGE